MLDDLNRIKKFDTGRVAESIAALPEQLRQVLGEAKSIKIPKAYASATQVVVNGMGGSNLGIHIIKAAFADQIKVPITLTSGYEVPAFVNKDTLYILSSYSGTTEEVLSVYDEVRRRGAKVMVIAAQGKGKLQKLMARDKLPGYVFRPEANPSDQPRLGLGYSIFGLLTLFAKAGLLKIDDSEFHAIIDKLKTWSQQLLPEVPQSRNEAKRLAARLHGKMPVLVASQFLTGNLHAMRNQVCENSKNMAMYLILPDLNHFAMEGLAYPKSNRDSLGFLFFESDLYLPRIQKRLRLTKEIVAKNKIAVEASKMQGATAMEQTFELLQLGAWFSFYLGILNQVNPVEIKWVDWFKQKLAED